MIIILEYFTNFYSILYVVNRLVKKKINSNKYTSINSKVYS